MRIESLAMFLAVIDAGSIRKASNELYITQQGLSRVIQHLESELGTLLFHRSNKRVMVTESGKLLEKYAREIVSKRDIFLEELASLNAEKDREFAERLTVLIMPMGSSKLMYHMSREHEEFNIADAKLIESSLSKIVRLLRESENPDLALADIHSDDLPAFREQHPDLVYDEVMSIPLTLLGKRELLAEHVPKVTLSALKNLPLACFNTPILNSVVERMLGDDADNIVMLLTSQASIDDAVQAGKAVSVGDLLVDGITAKRRGLVSVLLPCNPTTQGFLLKAGNALSDDQLYYIKTYKSLVSQYYPEFMSKRAMA